MSSRRIEREERAGASKAPGVYNFLLYVVFIYVNEFFCLCQGKL